jgi:hypothetical protein
VLNMFRTLIYLSSGACACAVKLVAEVCNTDTTPTQPHQISNTQRTRNKTTDVLIQQLSRKLLMMDILMSETCWVHKKWNKIAGDINLVFYSSAVTTMHGPINIWFTMLALAVCTEPTNCCSVNLSVCVVERPRFEFLTLRASDWQW